MKIWHEKEKRLRSSVYLGLRAPTARQRAERPPCETTLVWSLRFTMSSPSIISAGGQVPRGKGMMATSQGPKVCSQKLILARCTSSTTPMTAYGAVRRRCVGSTVRAPDEDFFGNIIQPALDHIEFVPPAHSSVKETSQVSNGGDRWSRIVEMCATFRSNPLKYISR